MAGDKDGAPTTSETLQEGAKPHDAFGVEPVGRLVEHQNLRITEESGRQREPLPHTHRETARGPISRVPQPDKLQHLVSPLIRHTDRGRVHPQVVTRGPLRMKTLGLEHSPDHTAGIAEAMERLTVDRRVPGSRRDKAEQHSQRGGLTGPVRPKEAGDSPRLDREAQILNSQNLTEGLRQVLDDNATASVVHAPSRDWLGDILPYRAVKGASGAAHSRNLHSLFDCGLRRNLPRPGQPQSTGDRIPQWSAPFAMWQTFANQMFVRHPPHLTRPPTPPPSPWTSVAPPISTRLVNSKKQTPPISQPTDLRPSQRQQSRRIPLLSDLVENIEPTQHGRSQRVVNRLAHGSSARHAAWSSACRNRTI
jgi:hypothetical protein